MSRRRKAFTLIELLVVVAIIALLISILLPSLSKAREQSRTTLCATRVGQMVRSMLLYGEDYEEQPPFTAKGFTNPSEDVDAYKLEDWISKDMDQIWMTPEEDWPDNLCPRSGSIFPYARFDALYRCPEFERIPNKTQNVFNITRSIFGRKMILPWEPGGTEFYGFLGAGPIMRASNLYCPARMFMLVDESWQFHVADINHYQNRNVNGPRCADPVWFGFVSEVGQYHAPGTKSKVGMMTAEGVAVPDVVKSGSHGFYDGHVDRRPDFGPGRNPSQVLFMWLQPALDWGLEILFAQRGIVPAGEQVQAILAGIIGW